MQKIDNVICGISLQNLTLTLFLSNVLQINHCQFFLFRSSHWYECFCCIKITAKTTRFCWPWHFDLYQRTSSEEACLVLLLVLATVVMRRGKKSVVCVAQCVAALIPVHRTPSLLPVIYRFLDLSGTSVRLPVYPTNWIDADFLWIVCLLLPPPLSCFLFVLYQTFSQSHLCKSSHNCHLQGILFCLFDKRSKRQGKQSLVVLAVIFSHNVKASYGNGPRCPSDCLSHTNISETKQDLWLLGNSNRKLGF